MAGSSAVTHVLIGEAARRLGLTAGRLRQLDAELQPRRLDAGIRLYSVAELARFEARRDARRAETRARCAEAGRAAFAALNRPVKGARR